MNAKRSKIIDDESENERSQVNNSIPLNETLKENHNDINENVISKNISNSSSKPLLSDKKDKDLENNNSNTYTNTKSNLNTNNTNVNHNTSTNGNSNLKVVNTEEKKISLKSALKSKFDACIKDTNAKKDDNKINNNTTMLNKKRPDENLRKSNLKYKSEESSSVSESSFYTEEVTSSIKKSKPVKRIPERVSKEKELKKIEIPKKSEIKQIKSEVKEKVVKPINTSVKKEENHTHKNNSRAITSSNENNYVLKINDKESVVYEILSRWWYISGSEWYKIKEPIENILERNNLREVKLSNWKTEDNVLNGKKKCIQLKAFPYVFFDCDDNLHDFRCKDNIPSYNNYMKKVRIKIK